MLIPLDVEQMARHWGLDPALIAAVDAAEGGDEALVKAVRCSIPSVESRLEALDITCRSCVHAMSDFLKSNPGVCSMGLFIAFWAKRWAPFGVDNDPTDLNRNWPTNVTGLYNAFKLHPPIVRA